jgi:competence ComEA-like helix-hairpin-helix protein
MRIGLISDTHDNVTMIKAAIKRLNELDVELVLHAGDYISPFTAKPYAELRAKMIGVYGNNCAEREKLKEVYAALGKELVGKICLGCHDSGNFRKARFTGEEWSDSVADMVERGASATPAELDTVVAYLAKNFGKGAPVRINTAPFAEIKAVLGFTVPEVRALMEYREKTGALKSLEELLKVPGVDPAKAEAQKSHIAFQLF